MGFENSLHALVYCNDFNEEMIVCRLDKTKIYE